MRDGDFGPRPTPEDATARWLDPTLGDVNAAIASLDPVAEATGIHVTAVTRHVNNARNEGPACVEPLLDR